LEFKVIISDGGNTYQKEIKGEEAARLVGLRIGEIFDGGLIGEPGELQITGGTDKDGFPMKRGIPGSRRAKILMKKGPGFIPRSAGERRKKQVRGDTISEDIVQINTTVVKKKEKKKKKEEKVEEEIKEIEVKEVKEEIKEIEVKEVKEEIKEIEVKEVKKKKEVKPKKKVEKEKPEPEVKPKKKVKKPAEKPAEKVEAEPIGLTKVRGIGKVTADQLSAAGITSVQEILKADTEKLAKKTGLSTKQIENLKASAQELMG